MISPMPGVILLSILSGRYPFFNSPDDLTALAELGAVFGTQEIAKIGKLFGKTVEFPQEFPALNLNLLCTSLQSRDISDIPLSAFDLLSKCLDVNPNTRISAKEALQHPFLKDEIPPAASGSRQRKFIINSECEGDTAQLQKDQSSPQ